MAVSSISIHAPLAGCDVDSHELSSLYAYFNPRTPCGVRLAVHGLTLVPENISIHAPLAGCDCV